MAKTIEQKFIEDLVKVFGALEQDTGHVPSVIGEGFNLTKFETLMAIHGFTSQGADLFPSTDDGSYFIEKAVSYLADGFIFGVAQVSADGGFMFEFSGY